ncbi:hypothetical protein CFC21_070448 [Triticum aestivum]|uniref:Rx N-terminal domain-containing protein n=2 Tax=Triticum aestivum TaxID=4565 RepID=A0A9R1F4W8_WHEAT|nr:hypothetical protein CFC21_034997 [Triticum aestivum]KAF7064005.1 hypothetical protein CFC21_070446 [Triticum aestivum]KAF7064007.1 hypothetical protein CFC21_070448 [Triticum aestivum]
MEDASGTFGFFFGDDMEAASSLSLITLPFLSAILLLEGLENEIKVNPLTNEAHRDRILKLLDEIIIDPNDPQNAGVILASRIRIEINKIVEDIDPYWLTDLSSNISALSEAVHGGVEWDHRVEYRRQALADLQEFGANGLVFKRAVRDVWPSSMGNPSYALQIH